MCSSTGTRSDSGSGRPWLHSLRRAAPSPPGGALEVDAERRVRRHLLDGRDVLHRGRGGEGVAIGRRERLGVAREEIARRRRVVRGEQRLEQEIRPRLHDPRHVGFELRAVGMGERHVAARDDEMHAHQRTFGEVRNERSDLAVEGRRQQPADHGAGAAAIGLARHVDEDRGEALVKVEAGEHPHPRPFVELQDDQREMDERVLVDLEQLVAGIGVEHVRERLAGMAVRREPRPCEHACDLAAEIGDVAGRAGIGGRGEQTDDLYSARRPAVAEVLDPDHVHRHPPVHPRARAGLGDQHQPALFEGRLRPRRHFDPAAADRARLALVGAQHAERRARNAGEHATVGFQPVFANAEEGEVVVLEPFEEGDGLGDLVLGQAAADRS